MSTKIVYQYDNAGMFSGITDADESPLEPGVWLIPAQCVEVSPPEHSENQWPRWNGAKWQLVTVQNQTATDAEIDPVSKLRDFLNSNPDVAALLQTNS